MVTAAQRRLLLPVLASLAVLLAPACTRLTPEATDRQGTSEPAPDREVGTSPLPAALGLANPNIRFGMPAPAQKDAASREAYLIERPQYVLSYNGEKRDPNWVCWRLRAQDIGNTARGAFEPDPDLPPSISHVTSHDYDSSGFDRGHMCPAKDRSASEEDMKNVFYMTNIVPQAPNCNQRGWERLEDYCRGLAKEGDVLYIACGPAGSGGEGKDGRKKEIGPSRRKITVPAKLWKVVLVLPREDAEPRKNSRVISVIMPNDQTVDYDWARFRVALRDVEKLTGYTFFRNVPQEVAAAWRGHVDDVEVRVPHSRQGHE